MKDGKMQEGSLRKFIEQIQKYKFVLLVLALGLLLLAWPHRDEGLIEKEGVGVGAFDLAETEARMEKVLSRIDGAGNVSLILTVKKGMEQIYATDMEHSIEGEELEERVTTVLISTGSGTEEVVTVQQIWPTFQGALVVCDGGDDPEIKLLITQAVAALTGLRSDKITVCK